MPSHTLPTVARRSCGAVLTVAAFTALALGAPGDATTRVSVSSDGAEADALSDAPSISGNGRFVAFSSLATNLVPGDGNGKRDIFVRDLRNGTTTRVSVDSAGAEADGDSHSPSISGNGRFVAFYSFATNLVASDGNGRSDIFVHDLRTGTTTRVSVSSSGEEADGYGALPKISPNGRFVAFISNATNLVPGDGNGIEDAFVHDLRKGRTSRVSVGSDGDEADDETESVSISGNGRFVAFVSYGTNLVPGDANDQPDVFVRDLRKRTTTRASVSTGGQEADLYSPRSSISANGRFVAFHSAATNLVPGDGNGQLDVFVRDLRKRTTTLVSGTPAGGVADGVSSAPSISANGRFVAFSSGAADIVPEDGNGMHDVFVRDLKKASTSRASVGSTGTEANGSSAAPSISAKGRLVAFQSLATNLVPDDGNGLSDIFLR